MSFSSFSLNCLLLGQTSFERIFQVTVADNKIISDYGNIPIKIAKVEQFKTHILSTKKAKFNSIDDPDDMNLYRVNVDDERKLIGVSTQDDIKNKLGGTFMLPQKSFKRDYFPEELPLENENVHMIISIPTSSQQAITKGTVSPVK